MNATPSRFDMLQWLDSDALVAFGAAFHVRRYTTGQVIYLQQETGDEMYRIAHGAVRMSVSSLNGREAVYLRFGSGDCFGVASLIDGEPRPHTASAAMDTELQVINAKSFAHLRGSYRSFDDALSRVLARMMRESGGRYADAQLSTLQGRIAQRIVEAVATLERMEQSAQVEFRLSQSELGSMVGASRQSVNQALRHLQAEGCVSMRNGAIIVHDISTLQKLATQR